MGWQHTKYIILLHYHMNLQEKNVMLTKLKWPRNSFLHSILWNSCSVYYTLENAEPERLILVLYLQRTLVCLIKAIVFSSGHICMWELGYEEGWALKNWCFWTVVLERTLGSPLDCREIKPINLREIRPGCSLKDWCWGWNSKALATWCEELTPWKRPWCWERLTAGGDRKDRGWDGWMASQTR